MTQIYYFIPKLQNNFVFILYLFCIYEITQIKKELKKFPLYFLSNQFYHQNNGTNKQINNFVRVV